MSEKEKMLRGELHNPSDSTLKGERDRAKNLCQRLNALAREERALRQELLQELFPVQGKGLHVSSPFYCDYGYNIEFGDDCYLNMGCTFLDGAKIRLGSRVLLGPNVSIYTPEHPLIAAERATGLERARPVTIGDDVWIGGSVTILAGVTIGAGTVIGTGSVVTKDIPAGVIAVGNPCKVLRPITEADRLLEQ